MKIVTVSFPTRYTKNDYTISIIASTLAICLLATGTYFYSLIIFVVVIYDFFRFHVNYNKKKETQFEINTYGVKATFNNSALLKWEEIDEVFLKEYTYRSLSDTYICLNLKKPNKDSPSSIHSLKKYGEITISTRSLDINISKLYHLINILRKVENLDKRNALLTEFMSDMV